MVSPIRFLVYSFYRIISQNGAPLFAIMDQIGGEMQKVSGSLLDYLVYNGDSEPRISGGISTTIRYKRFSLNTMFNYQLGHYKRLNPFITSSNNGMLSIPNADVMHPRNYYPAGNNQETKDAQISPPCLSKMKTYLNIYRTTL